MFKSCSYQYKQPCVKFFFQASLSGYSKKHLEISKENLFTVSLQKISLLPMKENSSITPPLWISNLWKRQGGMGGRGCLGMDTFWEYTMLFIYFVCLFIFAGSCTWTNWFELVVSWQVAQAFFHSSAWWNTTVRSALLSSGHFSNHPIKRSSLAPVQNVNHEDLSK